MILISFFKGEFKIRREAIELCYPVLLVFLVILFLRSLFKDVNITDLNHLLLFFALPLYFSFFLKYIKVIFEIIPFALFINIFISIIQQYNMIINPQWINYFNNYPPQELYIFPESLLGSYRVSSLFFESSQYSTYLAINIILFHQKFLKLNSFVRFTILLAYIDLFFNFSMTAYVIIAAYLVASVLNSKRLNLIGKIIIILTSIVVLFNLVQEKVYLTFSLSDESYPRLIQSIDAIKNTYDKNFYLGNVLTWDSPSWDIFSIYFTGYGLFGLLAIINFVFKLYSKNSLIIYFPFLLFLFTNGNLLGALNIYIMCLIFSLNLCAGRSFSSMQLVRHH